MATAIHEFAERDGGMECYIPLNPEKRARNMSIWQEVARRLVATPQTEEEEDVD